MVISFCEVVNWKVFITVYNDKVRKVSKGAKIRNRYNQVPHLTQDTKQFSAL